LDVIKRLGSWPVIPVFAIIERDGGVSFEEKSSCLQHGNRDGRDRFRAGSRVFLEAAIA
jgi:hypothetical protein